MLSIDLGALIGIGVFQVNPSCPLDIGKSGAESCVIFKRRRKGGELKRRNWVKKRRRYGIEMKNKVERR